jgi:hypothetical protein
MTRLSALPQELHLDILNYLPTADKIRLSATCKAYRAQLLPQIFTTIRLTNTPAQAESALAAVRAHGQYTTRLEVTCRCDAEEEVVPPVLTPAAAEVLRGCLTPNLRTVQLRFGFELDSGDEWDDNPEASGGESIYIFEAVEEDDYVLEREQQWKWRALIKETWCALAANQSVRELILDSFIPKWTSAFRTDEFRRFLSRLESAVFNILGLDNGAGWRTNTSYGYIEFLSTLDASFFRHMSGLKRLHLHAADPLGLEGMHHIPLALKEGDLPLLETLKLEDCFVGPELVAFIRSHARVLRSLDIARCVSAGSGFGMADNPLYWAEFFDQVYEAKSSLVELIVGGGRVPLTRDEEFDHDYDYTNEPDEVREIRRKLKADSRLKLFGYAYLDDKYGMFFLSEEENVDEFNKGVDQRAYDRLIGLVEENARQAGNIDTP